MRQWKEIPLQPGIQAVAAIMLNAPKGPYVRADQFTDLAGKTRAEIEKMGLYFFDDMPVCGWGSAIYAFEEGRAIKVAYHYCTG